MLRPTSLPLVLTVALMAVSCGRSHTSAVLEEPVAADTIDAPVGPEPVESAEPHDFDDQVRAVVAAYLDYGRIDDMNRWTPTLCTLAPGQGRFSDADDGTPHGRKLYYLYAKERDAYYPATGDVAPIGQVVVKEAFEPRLVAEDTDPMKRHLAAWGTRPVAKFEGKTYEPGEAHGLFVMMKLAPETPGTDEGWVYGTTTPTGEVTRSGRLDDCMGCHDGAATKDRLFGLARPSGRASGR